MTASMAQLTSASAINWSGGTPFNGYVLLVMALPSADGASWSRVNLRDARPRLRVPTRVKVPIREGQYDTDTRIWQTSALVPTNVKYASFFYDDTDRLIAAGPSLFTAAADPYTLAPPTLTDPTAASIPTDPEDVLSRFIPAVMTAYREDLAGTKNSSNLAFTATETARIAMVVWNGLVLAEGTDYTRSGLNYTMVIAPDSGDRLEIFLWD
jgi:hypothetical protein